MAATSASTLPSSPSIAEPTTSTSTSPLSSVSATTSAFGSKWRPLSKSSAAQRRRHSINVVVSPMAADTSSSAASASASALPSETESETADELKTLGANAKSHRRRQSIQESLHHITKSMSSSLQKAMTLGGSTSSLSPALSAADVGKTRLTKNFFKELLSAHFRQPDLKVTKYNLRHIPNPHTNQILHESEVWIKDGRGRRKLDLLIKYANPGAVGRDVGVGASAAGQSASTATNSTTCPNSNWVLDGTNDEMEREFEAYNEVIEDMWNYLRLDKSVAEPEQYLCLPHRYRGGNGNAGHRVAAGPGPPPLSDVIEAAAAEQEKMLNNMQDVLVLQDLFSAGYHSASQDRPDENGLDFNHSILAISRLARFHAVSYAFRHEHERLAEGDLRVKYPFLASDPVYRPDTADRFAKTQSSIATRLFNIFQHSPPELRQFSSFFLDAVKSMHERQSELVGADSGAEFAVLCHGDLWRQNVLFFYGSSLECQTDCVDVRFEDLHRVRYASCVTDLLYFLFTTVDSDVRRDHMMDFLAVYHDHFSKTALKLFPDAPVFSREALFGEFKQKLMFGFLEGLCLFSTVYESQLRKLELESSTEASVSAVSAAATAAEMAAARTTPAEMAATAAAVRPRYADYKDTVVAMLEDVVHILFEGEERNGQQRQQSKE